MAWPRIVVLLFGILQIALGLVGGLGLGGQKPSPPSFAGVVMGAVLVYFFTIVPKNPRLAYIGSTVLAMLTALNFGRRVTQPDARFFPHYLMLGAALLVVLLLTTAHFAAKAKTKAEA